MTPLKENEVVKFPPEPTWQTRFDKQFFDTIKLSYNLQHAEIKSFIHDLLSDLINEIPDDVSAGMDIRIDLVRIKQQLKDKYGIK